MFGLHENVDISKDLQQTKTLFESLLLTQGEGTQGASGGGDSTLFEIAEDILSKVLSYTNDTNFSFYKAEIL